MSEALRKMRVRTLVLLSIEIVLLGAGISLYYLDYPEGFREFMVIDYWIAVSIALMVIDILFLWFSEFRLSRIRQKTDLEAASIIGSDVQAAYTFGMIGLIVVDEDDVVMWSNDLFRDRALNLLDRNILEWEPKLAELKASPADIAIDIENGGKHYSVKYLADARLYIFKDTTEYQDIFRFSQRQATSIGIIMLDNYSDLAGKTEDDNNDLVSKIRAAIMEYCRNFGVLLRRFRNDSYFAVCNFESLDRMERDGFTLLETIHLLGKGQTIRPTLSVGFAHGFDESVNKLNEMANNAIDIAMSRGGDQVVVSHYGEDLRFYGGKSAALENTSRVHFRSLADSFMGIVGGASEVIVSGHKDMDMDALGSCLGIKAMVDRYVDEKTGKTVPCHIVYDFKMTEKKTRDALTSMLSKSEIDRITITPREAEERIRPTTLFVVVDVSVPKNVMGEEALSKSSKTIVIDHHRRGEEFIDKPVLTYIDPSAGSCSEIIAELVHYSSLNPRIEIPATYATIMLSGMFLDTNFFKSPSTGARSFEAAEILKEFGAENSKADDLLKDEIEEYRLVTSILSTMKRPAGADGVYYCVVDERDIVTPATLAKVANQVMRIKDVRAVFVMGRIENTVVGLSARSDGSISVQLLAEKLGGGGGHLTAAACRFANVSVAVVESRLLDILKSYLAEASNDTSGGAI